MSEPPSSKPPTIEQEVPMDWSRLKSELIAAGWSEGYVAGLMDTILQYVLTVPDNFDWYDRHGK